jgi:hypothetical protein
MTAFARERLKRVLSPAFVQYVRYFWWFIRVYTPHRLAALFIRRSPAVYGQASEFMDRIRNVNTFAPTTMCRIMTKHGSDKGRFRHNYTTIYSALFDKLRSRPLRIFELGLGTNNPDLPSSMGVLGRPGASLRGWRELFPEALVFGADVDRDIIFTEHRIQTFYCDQLDSQVIHDLWAQPAMQGRMDIIVDDGLHSFAANTSFLAGSLKHLRAGGVYIVEDIVDGEIELWRSALSTYQGRFPDYDFVLAELPRPSNDGDNNLILIRRRS